MKVYVNATTSYCCYLDDEQEKYIRKYASKYDLPLNVAIMQCQQENNCDLHLLENYDELFTSAYDVVEVVE